MSVDFSIFHKPSPEDKEWLRPLLFQKESFDCEYCFGNIFIWQDVFYLEICEHDGALIMRNGSPEAPVFAMPVGGNLRNNILFCKVLSDMAGVRLSFHSLSHSDISALETEFPGAFVFEHTGENDDYVYSQSALALLPGKKYHSKRNHCASFLRNNENCVIREISEDNIVDCFSVLSAWEENKSEDDDPGYEDETVAVKCALDNYFMLEFSGAVLYSGAEPCAFTFGERLNSNTFCTHVEKTHPDFKGAYAVINRLFADEFLQDFTYINREDDAGIEGLRKAKLSYYPTFMTEKYTAVLTNDILR